MSYNNYSGGGGAGAAFGGGGGAGAAFGGGGGGGVGRTAKVGFYDAPTTDGYDADAHTGDPLRDLAYEKAGDAQNDTRGADFAAAPAQEGAGGGGRQQQQRGGGGGGSVPEEVLDYLRYFRRMVKEQNVMEIRNLYEYGFPDLTERYFRERLWPNQQFIGRALGLDEQGEVHSDKIFSLLYKEMYFRYVYAKQQRGPNLAIRCDSYLNYQDLFLAIINCHTPIQVQLPDQWIWDIVDEFVYQFQSFCQFKVNPNKRNPDEVDELVTVEREVWNLYPVLNILYSVVDKSQIVDQLKCINSGGRLDDITDDFGAHPLYFKLGYFSLIGLLRVHTLMGDYNQALKTVEHLKLDAQGLYNTVPSCLVTLHYYIGFCRMMHRQYDQAIELFVDCLQYIQRTRSVQQQQQQQKTWQYDVISKTNDQLCQLLAICMSLRPKRIDESIQSIVNEKISADRMKGLQKGEPSDFEAAFSQGCPKFLNPTAINVDGTGGYLNKEPTQTQCRLLMEEVRFQYNIDREVVFTKEQNDGEIATVYENITELRTVIPVPVLRGYLKLYTTLPLEKLASFMEVDKSTLIGLLLSYKHKLHDILSTDADEDEEQTESSGADFDFYIDREMIHVADTKVGRRVGEYFIKHIQKLMEVEKNLKKLTMLPSRDAHAAAVGTSQTDSRRGASGPGRRY